MRLVPSGLGYVLPPVDVAVRIFGKIALAVNSVLCPFLADTGCVYKAVAWVLSPLTSVLKRAGYSLRKRGPMGVRVRRIRWHGKYIYNCGDNGTWYVKHENGWFWRKSKDISSETVHIISDTVSEGFLSHADGKIYDSKSNYRRELKRRGYIEVGDQTEALHKWADQGKATINDAHRQRLRETIAQAYYQHK